MNDASKVSISSMPRVSDYVFPGRTAECLRLPPSDLWCCSKGWHKSRWRGKRCTASPETLLLHYLGSAGRDFNLGMELESATQIHGLIFAISTSVIQTECECFQGYNPSSMAQILAQWGMRRHWRGVGVANSLEDKGKEMRGRGLEPLTSSMSRKRSNQLN